MNILSGYIWKFQVDHVILVVIENAKHAMNWYRFSEKLKLCMEIV